MSDIAASAAANISDPRLATAATPTANLRFPSENSMIYCNILIDQYQRARSNPNANFRNIAVIRLPMPNNINDSYNASVDKTTLGLLGAINIEDIEKGVGSIVNAAKNPTDTVKNLVSQGKGLIDNIMGSTTRDIYQNVKSAAITTAALLPGIADTQIGRRAQINKGIVPNPHAVAIFESMGLKSYSFAWRLSPKNSAESRAIESIITTIRNAMHPRQALGNFALEYPRVARVQFMGVKNIPGVRYSFIRTFNVNPYGFGEASFFRDGYPTSYEITLELLELETLFGDRNGNVNMSIDQTRVR